MSGIIGGAGSRSGIIGETELDYETGVFNATPMSFTTSGSATLHAYELMYTKIGKLISITGNFWFDTITSQNGALKLPLPFVAGVTGGANSKYRTVCHVANYESSDICVLLIEHGNTYGTFVKPQGWTATSMANGGTLVVNGTYHTL